MYPNAEILLQGAKYVLEWSRNRGGRSAYVRQQNMVLALQNLLLQLSEQRDYFGRGVRAYFENGIEHENETCGFFFSLTL